MRTTPSTFRIRRSSKNYWKIQSKCPELWHNNRWHDIDFVYGGYENALAQMFSYLNSLRYVSQLRRERVARGELV